jgi:hypothetical protein
MKGVGKTAGFEGKSPRVWCMKGVGKTAGFESVGKKGKHCFREEK